MNSADATGSVEEQRFRAIFDATPIPYALNDDDQNITRLNPAFVQTFGYTLDDIPTLSDWWPQAYPDLEYRQSVATRWRERLKSSQESGAPFEPMEIRIRCKNGTVRTVVVSAVSLTNAFADTHLVILYDITDRRKVEDDLRDSRQRLEYLSRELISTREAELQHFARELHDEVGQVLTAMKLNLRNAQRLCDARVSAFLEENVTMIDQVVMQVRNLALTLHPPHLNELGLVAALHWYLGHQAKLAGIEHQLVVDPPGLQISSDLALTCFRIAQEAVTNALRHANAREVVIQLSQSDNTLHLMIRDNGTGFEVGPAIHRAVSGKSIGLISMQERAKLAGGELDVESDPERGTTVHAWFDLPNTKVIDPINPA